MKRSLDFNRPTAEEILEDPFLTPYLTIDEIILDISVDKPKNPLDSETSSNSSNVDYKKIACSDGHIVN